MSGQKAARAFTLIELLVVIAILATLIAILIPTLNKARTISYRVKCAANLHALVQCNLMYAAEYNNVVVRNGGTGNPTVFYLLTVQQHIPLVTVAADGTNWESQYRTAYGMIKWLQCPSFPASGQYICFVNNGFDPSNVNNPNPPAILNLKRVVRPSEVCNFSEANVNLTQDLFSVYDCWSPNHVLYTANSTTTIVEGDTTHDRLAADPRHGKLINMAFYDGHVDSKDYKLVTSSDFANH